ncbi:MAG: hypothetical protein EAZ84_05000 [Verrucomicrobia bacterium]|nr:MAG: hypothetical protein EAZ84_05000 [Verrucomicrobiota bacterium]TAE88661.1 MAG: hypothetical protein EAZ82_02835 [Verrucomicrobiota bacterium]TAF26463.1 MAG: hypothetical protein EAZ71_04360 [Verrucomicrobiota bacterium]
MTDELLRVKIAKSLLNQQDPAKRKRLVLWYLGGLVGLFLAHHHFSGMTTPLKLVPQTMSAIGMGYVILCLRSVQQFGRVAEFIDWSKVKESAGTE